jgi:hypothetical protein
MKDEVDLELFVELLREAFIKKLSEKTGWGRNEVLSQFDSSAMSATVQYYKAKQNGSSS